MMLQQEKETPNSVAFKVEIPRNTSVDKAEVRKRLEAESEAAKAPAITID